MRGVDVVVGAALVLACGCDRVFGLERHVDAGAPPFDAPRDGTVDGADAPLDSSIDAPPDALPTPICPVTYGTIGTLAGKYRYLTTAMTWVAAEAACASDQVNNSTRFTHLVVVFPDAERSQLNSAHPARSWIGLSDRLTEAFYRWVTAESTPGVPPVSGSPWAPGEPDHQDPADDCVEMNATADFAESACVTPLPAWCECDANPIAPNF